MNVHFIHKKKKGTKIQIKQENKRRQNNKFKGIDAQAPWLFWSLRSETFLLPLSS